jgi:hypothetical protein
MKKCMLFVMVFILGLTAACNKDEPLRSIETFDFTGVIIGLVDQKGTNLDGLKINHTATLKDFNPTGEMFEVYNAEYPKDSKEKNIHITNDTKIYNSNNEEIPPTEINIGSKINFTVRVVNNHIIEAIEIEVLEE